ncbi:hypothetical protein F5880DRAFT_1088486 [Lentinula raphanica]|nr:hypothetical protein F5880DRAFT_1088486 [Lentinula raphanica]
MHLKPILSRIFVGALLYELSNVHATPIPQASDVHQTASRAERDVQWWNQLLTRPWIAIDRRYPDPDGGYTKSCLGYGVRSEDVLTRNLTKTFANHPGLLDPKSALNTPGNNHAYIHTVRIEGAQLPVLVKTLDPEVHPVGSEVIALEKLKALQDKEHKRMDTRRKELEREAGELTEEKQMEIEWRLRKELPWGVQPKSFLKAGFADMQGKRWALILMAQLPGHDLTTTEEWKHSDPRMKAHLLKLAFYSFLFKVHDLAVQTGMLYVDLDLTNLLYDPRVGDFSLVDFGPPSMFEVTSEFPSDVKEFLKDGWFIERFQFSCARAILETDGHFQIPKPDTLDGNNWWKMSPY